MRGLTRPRIYPSILIIEAAIKYRDFQPQRSQRTQRLCDLCVLCGSTYFIAEAIITTHESRTTSFAIGLFKARPKDKVVIEIAVCTVNRESPRYYACAIIREDILYASAFVISMIVFFYTL